MLSGMATIYRSKSGENAVRHWCLTQLESWSVEHQCQRVQAGGLDTHLLLGGSGPTTVVFVAGDRFNAAANLPLLTVLADRFRIAAADVPGQPGLSADQAGHERTLNWYATWLRDVVEQTQSTNCLLLGQSFGGAIALTCDSPLVSGRLVVSTGGLCRLRLTPAVLADFVVWTAFPRRTTSRWLLHRLMGPGHAPRPELIEWMTLVGRHTRPVSTTERVKPSRAIPTIVATGEYDMFLPPARLAPATREAFGNDLQVLAGGGHLVTEECPEELLALLEQLV
jgi:pimeloyl-ACP methyl ester carboxylesterase